MFTRKSGIMALVLGALVLGACDEDSPIVQPVQNPTITIAPNPVPAINTGSTFQLVAVTTNLPAGSTVTWISTSPAVATVDGNGLVRCLTAGNTTITGTIAATASTPAASNAVAITCQTTGGGPVVGTPTVSISRITDAAGLDVNPGNVNGVVNVVMNVDIPTGVTATAARVMVGTTEVCRTGFSGSVASEDAAASVPVTVVCSFNTAQLNATGVPLFPNGTYQIRAEVLNGTAVIAGSTSRTLVFNNGDALIVGATASGASATDAAGLIWRTGDLTVTVAPSIFSGAAVTSGVVTVTDANTGAVIAQAPLGTAAANGTYSVTFTKAVNTTSGLLDVSEAESPINVQVTTVAGGNPGVGFGPAQPGANPLRLDNDAPDTEAGDPAATFVNPGWFSTTTPLSTQTQLAAFVANNATLDDEGVNRNVIRLEYNTNAAATNTSAGWTTFTDVSALPETQTNQEIAIRAVVCDQLNNCTPVGPVQSGVDRSAPSATVGAGSASNNAINPATNLNIVGTDAISGASIVRARISGRSVFEIDANVDTDLRCYNAAGALVSTNPTSGVCPTSDVATVSGPGATETNATVIIPADENWYTIETQTVDIAGNISTTTITRNYLRDAELPTATIASTTITGTNATISGTVQDNIQVRQYDARFQFVGLSTPDEIPFTAPTVVDATLDNALTGQAAASASSSLTVRSIQEGIAGAAIQPTAYGFQVWDMANLFSFTGAAIAFGAGNGVANTAAVALTDSPDPICRTGTTAACANTANTSSTLTLTVQTTVPPVVGGVPQPFANPIARVYYYYTHPSGYLVLIGSTDASAATVQTNATNGVRDFVFTNTIAASSFPAVGAFPIHAIAVDSEGDAILVSGTLTVQ